MAAPPGPAPQMFTPISPALERVLADELASGEWTQVTRQFVLGLVKQLTVLGMQVTGQVPVVFPTMALTDAPVVAMDVSLGTRFFLDANAVRTIDSPTGAFPGQEFQLQLRNNTAGTITMVFHADYRLAALGSPAIPSGMTVTLCFQCVSPTHYRERWRSAAEAQ
jgi:hypothetical protein